MSRIAPLRRALFGLLLLAAGAGCDDGGGGVLAPPPDGSDPSGSWSVETVELSDPCELTDEGLTQFWSIELSGDEADVTMALLGACRVRTYTRTDDTLSRERRGFFIDPRGTDCVVRISGTEVLELQGSSFVGTDTSTWTVQSGTCFRPYPCELQLQYSGQRCNGCFPGCD